MRIGWLAAGGLALTVACCSGSGPCTGTNCPKVEGSYTMTYQDLTLLGPDCAALPPPTGPATIQITRSGAEVRATLLGAIGRGTIQDSSDFSISATDAADAGSQSYTLRGYYVPPSQRADGGARGSIVGKWLTRTEQGAKSCEAERPCTGIQQ